MNAKNSKNEGNVEKNQCVFSAFPSYVVMNGSEKNRSRKKLKNDRVFINL